MKLTDEHKTIHKKSSYLLSSFLAAIQSNQMSLWWGSMCIWSARTSKSQMTAQHNEKAAIPHDGSKYGGRAKFLISNYTW